MKNSDHHFPSRNDKEHVQVLEATNYRSLISSVSLNVDLEKLVFDTRAFSNELNLGQVFDDVSQHSSQESTLVSNNTQESVLNLSTFLKTNKLEFISSDLAAFRSIFAKETHSIAFLNSNESINLYLNEVTSSTIPMLLVCRLNSSMHYVLVKPSNLNGWRIALEEKLSTIFSNNFDSSCLIAETKVEIKRKETNVIARQPNPELIELLSKLKHKFNNLNKDNSLVPSIYTLLGCSQRYTKYSIYCQPHISSSLVIVFMVNTPNSKQFIKLTHRAIEEQNTMKYLAGLDQQVKQECNHIAQIYRFNRMFLKDNNDLFFTSYLLNKKHLGKETCDKLNIEDFGSSFVRNFFSFEIPIELTYMELLEPIRIKELLESLPKSTSSLRIKILVLVRWIGHCMEILRQLHSKLNILHCDISFDNILTRKNQVDDKISQQIRDECRLNGITSDEFVTDLVISDLNMAIPLTTNLNDISRSSISNPNVSKFPYTWHSYDFYGTTQSDHYAMAIFIAKLVRRFLFEDFTDFAKIDKFSKSNFDIYGNSVLIFFKEKLKDETNPLLKSFLEIIIELLLHIILQKIETPSNVIHCINIHSQLSNLVHPTI